ncbi:class I SAM-dependent methyltransferase [Bizionia hallyeonensis]|uniref:Class I SAM-dependent methyltransferase n=1 Tax=Bizionia hallyeonensis TaxID=1123757 RepID=A0ABW0C889_9FLAO
MNIIVGFLKKPSAYLKVANQVFTRWIRTYAYRGSNVICENCSWQGTQFFEGECPNCKSLPRTRLIPFSIDYFDLAKTKLKVLHVAPNKTEYFGVKTKLHDVMQYDKMDIRAVKHVNLVEDLTQLTLEDNTYDLVVIWHVFEHIVEDTKAISEVYRVLNTGGQLLMSVPIFPVHSLATYEDVAIPYANYQEIHGHEDHCRSCGLDYYKRFEAHGFRTAELQVRDLDDSLVKKYALSTGHVAWCFTK